MSNVKRNDRNKSLKEQNRKKKQSLRNERNQIRTEIVCGKNLLNTTRLDLARSLKKGMFIYLSYFYFDNCRSTVMITPGMGHQLQTLSTLTLLRVRGDHDIR